MSLTPPRPEEVRAFRKTKGWTQAQMAEAFGVSTRAVETWESRKVDPADPLKGAPPLYLRHAIAAMLYGTSTPADLVAAVEAARPDEKPLNSGPVWDGLQEAAGVKPARTFHETREGLQIGPAPRAPGSLLKRGKGK